MNLSVCVGHIPVQLRPIQKVSFRTTVSACVAPEVQQNIGIAI